MASEPSRSRSEVRRVALSSYLGTTIEYYDFLLYGTAAALVFNKVFFSNLSPVIGTIVALATLAAGYAARFLGAVVFGHFGDRFGRKNVMLVTLVVMGLTSGAIGLLPTYDQIGSFAPLMLVGLRLLQGFAVGGEYGGAVLMASEHAQSGRRGLASSAAAMGAPSGSVLATAAMLAVAAMPDEQMLSWGWRVPFIASFAMLALALYFRTRISESPVFLEASTTSARPAGAPITRMLKKSPTTFVKATLFQIGPYAGQGVFGIFIISYAPTIGYSRSTALLAVMLGTLGSIALTPVYASLSDRIGRRPVVLGGILATAILAFPLFHLVNLGNPTVLVAAVAAYLALVMPAVTGVAPVLLTELFDTELRYTGVSTTYQLAQTVGSGFSPLIATSLLAMAGGGSNTWLIAVFLIVLGVLSATAAFALPDNFTRSLASTEGSTRQRAKVVDPQGEYLA
ncbi:MFS transporter [Rhodococcus sp. BUPNP1]|uniref:MFS transporter n=1 Tax=Rhodococcus sp. BUPNP1 TaxID=1432786 RepID=UPI000B5AAA6C|nr:MFS transporter [Rhodococcus sp. BUPNP1]OWY81528.1 hypothetical protein B9C99_12775 [Rhodococcus sp. BUPNP1]